MLRQLRASAGLTQEELAEAARLSPRSISDLERGVSRTARNETARMLADALGLTGPDRARFEAVAGGRAVVPPDAFAAAVTRTLPRDVWGFTGRSAELRQLVGRLPDAAAGVVGICAIGGMAGVGKTALAVHAAHLLAERFPDGQLFLPLHAHTPGQRPVGPADALASLLLAAGFSPGQIPSRLDERAGRWRGYLAGKKVLLVLDDAAGHEQVRPLLPGTGGSLVLVTSRRRLAALEGAAVISLDTLLPGEGAELLARLAHRPGLRPDDADVGEIARLCGYLPLAIWMLASQLRHHPAWAPAIVVAELAAARGRLDLLHAEDLSVAAAFDLSYRDLTPGQRRLFRRLGLHPGADIDAHAAAALDGTSVPAARRHLEALYALHLITEPAQGRYRLHDLLREHAQALAAGDDRADREAATGRLLDYFLHTAVAAGKHIPSQHISDGWLPPELPPGCAPPVSTHRQAVSWLKAERANLQAAAGLAAASGRFRHAMWIPAAMAAFLLNEGHWDQAQALLQIALTAAHQVGDRSGEGESLLLLGMAQVLMRDLAGAAATFDQALGLYGDLDDLVGQGNAYGGIGLAHLLAGRYRAAAVSTNQALDLFARIGNQRGQASALNDLAMVHWITGSYPAAAACAGQALDLFRSIGHRPGEIDALMNAGIVQELTGDYQAAAAAMQQAMTLSQNLGDRYMQAWILNELGVLQRRTGDYRQAADSHQRALAELRGLGQRHGWAGALNDLGVVQQLTGDYHSAATNHQLALELFIELGERYGQADVLNNLGELSLRTTASQQARRYHAQALAIARDLGVPLEEARAREGIGRSYLYDGNTKQGTIHLQQALDIYQRIGAPEARRIHETLAAAPGVPPSFRTADPYRIFTGKDGIT
jgi:tetratricopeptide (TPR) repeat protein/transcriptional regulator with XRE-family HTH domain